MKRSQGRAGPTPRFEPVAISGPVRVDLEHPKLGAKRMDLDTPRSGCSRCSSWTTRGVRVDSSASCGRRAGGWSALA